MIEGELPHRQLRNTDEIKQKFYDDLDVSPGNVYVDKVGDPILIDDELFTGWSGYSKLRDKKKISRALFVDEFAAVISDPDEIWLEYDEKRQGLVKKMLRFYRTPNGAQRVLIALFEYLKDKTQGVTLYMIDSGGTIEKKRMQKLVYRKESR